MKALVFAPGWPPVRTPRATMNQRVLTSLNWEGDVVVADAAGTRLRPERLPKSDLRVWRIGVRWPDRAFNALALLGTGSWLADLPDRRAPWLVAASALGLAAMRPKQRDILVSISSPDSAHVAALTIKERAPDVPWLAYFGDLWLELEQFGYRRLNKMSRGVNYWLERKVVERADGLVFTNRWARELFLERYPYAAKRTYVIPQCFDPEQYPERPESEASRPLVLRYLGDFYKRRSPMPLLQAIQDLQREDPRLRDRWRFELIGRFHPDDGEACLELIEKLGTVRALGSVPYGESLEKMVSSDVLLVIDAPAESSPFLPSKVVEYLGADRPILALTPAGAAAQAIGEAGGVVADVNDPRSIREALRTVAEAAERGQVEHWRPRPEVRARYTRQAVVAEFARVAGKIAQA